MSATSARSFGKVGRVVIKVGTRLLSDDQMLLDKKSLGVVTGHVMAARNRGAAAVLVTSGAVGAGIGVLKLGRRPGTIVEKQACAAVGQSQLMHEYQTAFTRHSVHTAQILLTRSDVADRRKQQNIRRVMSRLLADKIIPIVNENDVVADDELKFGDNDTLSGLVADLVEADMLIILTDVDGLYSSRGRNLSGQDAGERIPIVTSVNADIYAMAGGAGGITSTGGMITKVKTADRMARAGRVTVIADGRDASIVEKILDGDDVGTLFLPAGKKIESRKRWIADHLMPQGRIIVDDGAAEALRKRGGSLLPSGIKDVEGNFLRGSAVEVVDSSGVSIGQGLSAYGSREISLIKGQKSSRIKSIIGPSHGAHGDEVIHRNDLVIL